MLSLLNSLREQYDSLLEETLRSGYDVAPKDADDDDGDYVPITTYFDQVQKHYRQFPYALKFSSLLQGVAQMLMWKKHDTVLHFDAFVSFRQAQLYHRQRYLASKTTKEFTEEMITTLIDHFKLPQLTSSSSEDRRIDQIAPMINVLDAVDTAIDSYLKLTCDDKCQAITQSADAKVMLASAIIPYLENVPAKSIQDAWELMRDMQFEDRNVRAMGLMALHHIAGPNNDVLAATKDQAAPVDSEFGYALRTTKNLASVRNVFLIPALEPISSKNNLGSVTKYTKTITSIYATITRCLSMPVLEPPWYLHNCKRAIASAMILAYDDVDLYELYLKTGLMAMILVKRYRAGSEPTLTKLFETAAVELTPAEIVGLKMLTAAQLSRSDNPKDRAEARELVQQGVSSPVRLPNQKNFSHIVDLILRDK